MFSIDPRDPRALYEQIIDHMKEQVLKGVLKPGDQVPSVRQLAGMLTINANTVMKAYGELERQHIIETIRGRGTFIAQLPEKTINEGQLMTIRKELKSSCLAMHYMGLSKEDVLGEVSRIYDELTKEG
nr:GntR family transcriptional regulator [uncultured Cellulosilyticum sp.]